MATDVLNIMKEKKKTRRRVVFGFDKKTNHCFYETENFLINGSAQLIYEMMALSRTQVRRALKNLNPTLSFPKMYPCSPLSERQEGSGNDFILTIYDQR